MPIAWCCSVELVDHLATLAQPLAALRLGQRVRPVAIHLAVGVDRLAPRRRAGPAAEQVLQRLEESADAAAATAAIIEMLAPGHRAVDAGAIGRAIVARKRLRGETGVKGPHDVDPDGGGNAAAGDLLGRSVVVIAKPEAGETMG